MAQGTKQTQSISAYNLALAGFALLILLVLGLPAVIGAWLPDLLRSEAICVAQFDSPELGQFFVLQELGNDFYGARFVRITPSKAIENYVIDGDAPKYWSAFSSFSLDRATGILSFASSGGPICEYDTKRGEFFRTWSKRVGPLERYNSELSLPSSRFGQWVKHHLNSRN